MTHDRKQPACPGILYDGSMPIQSFSSSKSNAIKRSQKDLEFIQRMEKRDQERKARRAELEAIKKQRELELQVLIYLVLIESKMDRKISKDKNKRK